jgi:hypothetical protein
MAYGIWHGIWPQEVFKYDHQWSLESHMGLKRGPREPYSDNWVQIVSKECPKGPYGGQVQNKRPQGAII